MTAPYLGGMRITSLHWDGTQSMVVAFSSSYGSTYHYQVYVGRELAGVTDSPDDRFVIASAIPGEWPEHITLLAVTAADRLTEYGSYLPDRPYNRVRLTWTASGYAADTRCFEITAGTTPGGAVDPTNVLENVLFDTNRDYIFVTPMLEGSGDWNFGIAARDGTVPDGNLGTEATVTATILAYPPDVSHGETEPRFTATVATGTLTVSFTESI